MNNFEPSEYKSYKSSDSEKKSNANDPYSFSVSWTNNPNMQGVNPPNPQFQQAPDISYILPQTILPGPSEYGKLPVGIIQSKREPYGVQEYWGLYGNLSSKLGTNLGT